MILLNVLLAAPRDKLAIVESRARLHVQHPLSSEGMYEDTYDKLTQLQYSTKIAGWWLLSCSSQAASGRDRLAGCRGISGTGDFC